MHSVVQVTRCGSWSEGNGNRVGEDPGGTDYSGKKLRAREEPPGPARWVGREMP